MFDNTLTNHFCKDPYLSVASTHADTIERPNRLTLHMGSRPNRQIPSTEPNDSYPIV